MDSDKKAASPVKLPPIAELGWYETSEPQETALESVAPPDTQLAALLVMKAALIETTASRGWHIVERFAETVCRDLEKKALLEDDDEKASGLRRDARGALKFKDDLFTRIRLARDLNTEDGFVEVVTD